MHCRYLQSYVWAVTFLGIACFAGTNPPESNYPLPSDLDQVGEYPALTKSGGGYFYDEVLEYRVWIHPEEGSDYFHAFRTYEEAQAFSRQTRGAEEPLVLIRQHEWIDEPEPGQFIPKKGERVTEWRVEWLVGSLRGPTSIQDFLASPRQPRN